MSSKRNFRRQSCERKRRYTRCIAYKLAGWWIRRGEDIHAYKCAFCGGWHVGHITAATRRWQVEVGARVA